MTKAEINKAVFDKYPKTQKERTCWQEQMRLTALREQYRRRLEKQAGNKEQYVKEV